MTDLSAYKGGFTCWADVGREFGEAPPFGGWGRRVKSVPGAPQAEPDVVFHASYDQEDYEGSALVVYRQGERYFVVEGSHCSCYGLEGQWEPEEYDRDTLIAAWERVKYLDARKQEALAAIKASRG